MLKFSRDDRDQREVTRVKLLTYFTLSSFWAHFAYLAFLPINWLQICLYFFFGILYMADCNSGTLKLPPAFSELPTLCNKHYQLSVLSSRNMPPLWALKYVKWVHLVESGLHLGTGNISSPLEALTFWLPLPDLSQCSKPPKRTQARTALFWYGLCSVDVWQYQRCGSLPPNLSVQFQ